METFTAADRICLGAEVSGEIPATSGGIEPSAYLHKQLAPNSLIRSSNAVDTGFGAWEVCAGGPCRA